MSSLAEAHAGQGPSLVEAVGVTLSKRVRERVVRIAFSLAAAAIFHPVIGLAVAAVWLVAFLLTQTAEMLLFRNGRVHGLAAARGALALIFVSNAIFAAFPICLAARGGNIGAAVGMLMIIGALIHAGLASGRSRWTAGAAVLPQMTALACLPIIMAGEHVPMSSILMLTSGGLMLCWAAFSAWRRIGDHIVTLERLRHEADRANQAKSDFLTMVSHEIRTPLNGIMGMAQSLSQDTLTASQRGRLDILIASGRGLNDLIADVLDLSRIESGLLPLQTTPFDLRELVARSIEPFRAVTDAKGLDLSVSLCPGLAGGYLGDPVRIRQVLHGLIGHAVQLTAEGGVLVSASRDADGVRLSVCDSGSSMPASRLERIFDRYAQADDAAARSGGGVDQGLGLGLFMANELVQRMGGGITATNRVPQGLCLTAALPLAIAGVRVAEAAPVPALAPARLPQALRILAAEDHPVNRKVLGLLLDQIDVVPTMVENGLLAVQACREEDWDLVLMDVQMPVLDGVSAARQILDEARAAGRPAPAIVAVTANVMAHQLEDYASAGMPFHVAKPVEAGALFQTIQRALASRPVLFGTDGRPAANGPV